jgi:hypothetical protein
MSCFRENKEILTIFSPLDADWGLPGISRRRRYAQRSEIVDGVELAIELPSFEDLNSGTSLVWNTRGWTLQEKVCSHALLVSLRLSISTENCFVPEFGKNRLT